LLKAEEELGEVRRSWSNVVLKIIRRNSFYLYL